VNVSSPATARLVAMAAKWARRAQDSTKFPH
jgi:hypothetical protein